MRDYKFQQREWPLRKKKSGARQVLFKALAILLSAAVGYTGFEWFKNTQTEKQEEGKPTSQIIPLPIPPHYSTGVQGTTTQQPAPEIGR